MKIKNTGLTILIILCLALAVTSCAIKEMILGPPEPTVLEEQKLPHRVAILPFVNKTTNPEASSIVRKMFYNFFGSLNYLDMEPFVIDDNLKRNDLYQSVVAGEAVPASQLGQLLGVDAVIYGQVLNLGKTYAFVYADNAAALKATMVRCNSGQVIRELDIKEETLKLFSRCIHCNDSIQPVERESVIGQVPDFIFETHQSFWTCKACRRIFWQGSHHRQSLDRIKQLFDD